MCFRTLILFSGLPKPSQGLRLYGFDARNSKFENEWGTERNAGKGKRSRLGRQHKPAQTRHQETKRQNESERETRVRSRRTAYQNLLPHHSQKYPGEFCMSGDCDGKILRLQTRFTVFANYCLRKKLKRF